VGRFRILGRFWLIEGSAGRILFPLRSLTDGGKRSSPGRDDLHAIRSGKIRGESSMTERKRSARRPGRA
jgi:hypothetical protein